jgi:hypothetical protein
MRNTYDQSSIFALNLKKELQLCSQKTLVFIITDFQLALRGLSMLVAKPQLLARNKFHRGQPWLTFLYLNGRFIERKVNVTLSLSDVS